MGGSEVLGKHHLGIAVAAVATLLLCGCMPAAEEGEAVSTESTPAAENQAAPAFQLASLDGEQVSPLDFGGRVVVIDFWATWCGPCHAQADILRSLHADFDAEDVQFLAISLGEPEETVREFVDDHPYPYPVLIDPADEVSLDLGIYVLPTIMVIDREGMVAYLEPGVSDAETLRRVLYEAGVEHPATTAS